MNFAVFITSASKLNSNRQDKKLLKISQQNRRQKDWEPLIGEMKYFFSVKNTKPTFFSKYRFPWLKTGE
jgi:transposase